MKTNMVLHLNRRAWGWWGGWWGWRVCGTDWRNSGCVWITAASRNPPHLPGGYHEQRAAASSDKNRCSPTAIKKLLSVYTKAFGSNKHTSALYTGSPKYSNFFISVPRIKVWWEAELHFGPLHCLTGPCTGSSTSPCVHQVSLTTGQSCPACLWTLSSLPWSWWAPVQKSR